MIHYNLKHIFKSYWFFITVLFVMLFLVLSDLNHSLFFAINAQHIFAPDAFWNMIIMISDQKVLLCAILFAITYLFHRDKAFNVAIIIGAYFAVFYLLKITVHEARPYIQYDVLNFHWLPQEDMEIRAFRSFPSGHTGVVAIFIFTISRLFLQKPSAWYKITLQIILFALLLLTMLAQICTGWHFPVDVIGSGLIGYFLVAVII